MKKLFLIPLLLITTWLTAQNTKVDETQVRNLTTDLANLASKSSVTVLTPDKIPNVVSWWDFSDLSLYTANSSQAVSAFADKLGVNNLTAGTAPLLKFDGGNGFPCINFTSTKTISKTFAQALPFTFYLYVRNNASQGNSNNVVVGFRTSYTNSIIYHSNGALQAVAGSNFYYGAGQGARFKGNKWTLYRFSIDASGKLYTSVDNSMIFGNLIAFPPSTAGTNDITAVTFGDNVSGSSTADFDLQEVVLVAGQPSLSDDANIRNYFFKKYNTTKSNLLYGIGNSVMYGNAASDEAHNFLHLTAGYMDADYYNLGIPGQNLGYPPTNGSNLLGTAIINQLDFRDPNAYFLIEYGINDGQGTNPNWIALYEADVQILLNKGVPANHIGLCSTTYDSTRIPGNPNANTAIAAVAAAKGCIFMNYYPVLQAAGIDATHPPDAGMALMATVCKTGFGF